MQVENEESLLLLATYTKYSRKTHSQTFSTTQVGQPPSNPPLNYSKSDTQHKHHSRLDIRKL